MLRCRFERAMAPYNWFLALPVPCWHPRSLSQACTAPCAPMHPPPAHTSSLGSVCVGWKSCQSDVGSSTSSASRKPATAVGTGRGRLGGRREGRLLGAGEMHQVSSDVTGLTGVHGYSLLCPAAVQAGHRVEHEVEQLHPACSTLPLTCQAGRMAGGAPEGADQAVVVVQADASGPGTCPVSKDAQVQGHHVLHLTAVFVILVPAAAAVGDGSCEVR